MEKYREQFQYTFRLLDTHMQFIETTYTEAEARETVAKIALQKLGLNPEDPANADKLRICREEQLRLVNVR